MKNSFPSPPAPHGTAALPGPSAARAIGALMLREMATSYGRAPGGYVWAVAEPAAAIGLLTLVFSVAFDAPPLGQSFALFYATGYLPFVLFSDLSARLGTAPRFSRPLLAYPAVTAFDALAARFVLTLLTHAAVIAIVLAAIEATQRTGALYHAPALLNALAMAACLGAGAGALNAVLFTRFPVWERLWQIGTRPLFVISGIFFVIEDLPASLRAAAWFNPLLHVTGEMRRGTYATYAGASVCPAFVYGTGLAALVLGLLLLRRAGREVFHD